MRVTLIHRGGGNLGIVELLSGCARRLMEHHIDASILSALPAVDVFQTISLWSTAAPVSWSAMSNPWGPGLALDRESLAARLRCVAANEGVILLGDAQVSAIESRHGISRISMRRGGQETFLQAGFVIIATGRTDTSLFNRKMTHPKHEIALMSHACGRDQEAAKTLYLEAAPDGWWSSVPDPDGGQLITFCTSRAKVTKRQGSLGQFWRSELRRTKLFASLFFNTQNGPVKGRDSGLRSFDPMCGESWVAVGDAAFAPDPLSGLGIELAIKSSLLAIRAYSSGSRARALHSYEHEIRQNVKEHEHILAMFLRNANIQIN